ncbi:hypothetical protein TRFO_10770 [Tritrichomonas foetus]|uniref:Uncharacterized protein n=1 Tax=Tritrichomonas foetus TaxID=1144522 RepID=A0A1J4J6P1_9EUKA|nr:hypothetical protein TRFO_10770 [Tritrichomonas foetus]|eukprot:OHS94856.1 hypothetical protein TRFO_10770 [Tritrichomonas foetus]
MLCEEAYNEQEACIIPTTRRVIAPPKISTVAQDHKQKLFDIQAHLIFERIAAEKRFQNVFNNINNNISYAEKLFDNLSIISNHLEDSLRKCKNKIYETSKIMTEKLNEIQVNHYLAKNDLNNLISQNDQIFNNNNDLQHEVSNLEREHNIEKRLLNMLKEENISLKKQKFQEKIKISKIFPIFQNIKHKIEDKRQQNEKLLKIDDENQLILFETQYFFNKKILKIEEMKNELDLLENEIYIKNCALFQMNKQKNDINSNLISKKGEETLENRIKMIENEIQIQISKNYELMNQIQICNNEIRPFIQENMELNQKYKDLIEIHEKTKNEFNELMKKNEEKQELIEKTRNLIENTQNELKIANNSRKANNKNNEELKRINTEKIEEIERRIELESNEIYNLHNEIRLTHARTLTYESRTKKYILQSVF